MLRLEEQQWSWLSTFGMTNALVTQPNDMLSVIHFVLSNMVTSLRHWVRRSTWWTCSITLSHVCWIDFFFIYPCAGFEFPRSLPLSHYLCRAAHGSADIPILPHTHTILLKHAVNLKRKMTLFASKGCLHHPIVLPTSHCCTNVGFPP